MKEFQIIEQYFAGQGPMRKDVVLGVGDDCALVQPADDKVIAISCDTFAEGTHFLSDMPAADVGFKSLAVNLSDLASMGAEPAWMTLALTLPEIDESWLKQYCEGLYEIAEYYNISLVGGDTTRGARSITITVNGQVPESMALTRGGAGVGDWVYVTGTLGDSALGLDILLGNRDAESENKEYLIGRHYRPTPRMLAGQSLRGIASSAIDLSDGLISDIQHVLKSSEVGAIINVDQLPLSKALISSVGQEQAIEYALAGGEDYELLFTVPDAKVGALTASLNYAGVNYTRVGQITAGRDLELSFDGRTYVPQQNGFKHF
ncbi:thiamine-phosphate kinase [Parashewanella spongiae]|uniref:Thiamine-monophosphate kinase n=1 Tax=Parashewanella spongiae TaxID=342950 RepID=A0A3A6TAJ8_9GAMM|nr:thiamine-phosphate kinase [Parashewanella spongiae]MCL1078842.1 thiamine-phosphate kinase [Parashewanella spongiae]RJY02108.1 thiamine-phosphate kinase [Parashewanella spongiae]